MRYLWVAVLLALASFPLPASSQQTMTKGDKDWVALEKVLEDVNLQWLCAGKYYKAQRQDCVDFRSKYWVDQFFEIGRSGRVLDKTEMVTSQTATAKTRPTVAVGEGPNPQEFKLMAVVGDVALAVDRTIFKAPDASGKVAVTGEARVLRMFVKENGTWRPLGAALVGIPQQ